MRKECETEALIIVNDFVMPLGMRCRHIEVVRFDLPLSFSVQIFRCWGGIERGQIVDRVSVLPFACNVSVHAIIKYILILHTDL